MTRARPFKAGVFALAALTLQLVLGASALPCDTTDPFVDGGRAENSAAMTGMSMPDAGTSQHDHEGCDEQENIAACHTGAACVIAAIPSAAATLSASSGAAALPLTPPVTLVSALTAPDLPPPRA